MRLKAEIEKAVELWKGKQAKVTEFTYSPSELVIRKTVAQGVIDTLEWVLGTDNEAFGPVREKRPKREHVGRPTLDIDLRKLWNLRRRGRSLMNLAKEFGTSKATIVKRLRDAKSVFEV